MVFGEINDPRQDVIIHGAGLVFKLAGDNLHPVVLDESAVKIRAQKGGALSRDGAKNGCQPVEQMLAKFLETVPDQENVTEKSSAIYQVNEARKTYQYE